MFKTPGTAPLPEPSFRIIENHTQHIAQNNSKKLNIQKNIRPKLEVKNLTIKSTKTPLKSKRVTREKRVTRKKRETRENIQVKPFSKLTYEVTEISTDLTYDFSKPLLALLDQAIKLRKAPVRDYKTAIYILELTLRSIQPGGMRFKYQCELANNYKLNEMHDKAINILTEMRKIYVTNKQRKEIHCQLKSTHESSGNHVQALIHKSFVIALELNNLRTIVNDIESSTDISASISPTMYRNMLKNNKSFGRTGSGHEITDPNWAVTMDKIDNILCVETLSRKLINPKNKITSMIFKKTCISEIHNNFTQNTKINFDDLASTINLSAA